MDATRGSGVLRTVASAAHEAQLAVVQPARTSHDTRRASDECGRIVYPIENTPGHGVVRALRRESGQPWSLRCFLHFAITNAGRAGADAAGSAVYQRANILQVDVPAALGHIVGVADAVAELGPSPAHFTYLSHKTEISSVLQRCDYNNRDERPASQSLRLQTKNVSYPTTFSPPST